RLQPGEQIVLVATASAHRKAAFEACEFLIDFLKTRAPFWKKEDYGSVTEWVESLEADNRATEKWYE
ncbi:MAG: molybdenum cofactor biosynthesis protein MoaE, partial [Rhodospirillales bacterium]